MTEKKKAGICLLVLCLLVSCFEVMPAEAEIKAPHGVWFMNVTLADGTKTTLYHDQNITITQPAEVETYYDLMQLKGAYQVKHTVTPKLRITLADNYYLAPKMVVAAVLLGYVEFSSHKISERLTVFTRVCGKKIAMVDLRYPYGKQKVYMSGSLFTTAARFWHSGLDVEVLDFNIDTLRSPRARAILNQCDIIGVSVVGSPYMKQLVRFCKVAKKKWPTKPVLLGGQVMMAFSNEQFSKLFFGTNAVLIKKDVDLAPFDIPPERLPPALNVSLMPILMELGDERLKTYLSHEMPLVISQGCVYNCDFCSADINRPETYKNLESFTLDLKVMTQQANRFGLRRLEFYATNLDFFQTPFELEKYLREIAKIRQESGVEIKIRALACLSSFLAADKKIADLKELLSASGFWCVGFGVDGPNEEIWKSEHKAHNRESDIPKVLQRTQDMGLVTEILMIMGDKRYDLPLLIKTVHFCYGFIVDWPHTLLRLHVAKVLPGSKDWFKSQQTVPQYLKSLLDDPTQFSNLDVLALASPVTHPDKKQRRRVNLAYLSILLLLRLAKRCVSSTLIPQGGYGPLALMARLINRYMPFDR